MPRLIKDINVSTPHDDPAHDPVTIVRDVSAHEAVDLLANGWELYNPDHRSRRGCAMTDSTHPLIVTDHNIRGGIPTLLGTRLGALEIAAQARIESPDDLYAQYPSLTPDLLAAALAYAGDA